MARGTGVLLFLAIMGMSGAVAQVPIVQPGAPGQPSRVISATEAADLSKTGVTAADVKFMQGMLHHHAQAVAMTALLRDRTQREDMKLLGQRISLSQADEMKMMQSWLGEHHEPRAGSAAHPDSMPGMDMMPGMLTPTEMARLAAAHGRSFDKLFLEGMIKHHEGALVMVKELFDTPRAGQDAEIFSFASDVDSSQRAEITRMRAMLDTAADDPRTTLKPGYENAGQAARNMKLIAHMPLPPGFIDPVNPSGFIMPPTAPLPGKDSKYAQEAPKRPPPGVERAETNGKGKSPPFAFANTDIVFSGNRLIIGNFHGFNTYDIASPDHPRLLASTVCPGGQADLSVYKNLLFMSVEQTFARVDCGSQGVAEAVSKERFRGIRIFDISDLNNPRQVAAVQTCRGSHTNTLVPDPKDPDVIYLYNSATSSIRSAQELEGCSDKRDDPNTALFRIDVIKVSLREPEKAAIVTQPRIFADPQTGAVAGLWKGGDYGPGTQATYETDTCHDITVYPPFGLAAGACQGNGILLDIRDPSHPVRIDQVADPNFAFWHSATFSNDGTKVVFTDEWGGGARPRCQARDPKNWGADAVFDIVDRKLKLRGYYKMPAIQGELETCVAHNGGLIPVPGRDILAQGWFQGGLSIMDFTDASHPIEIAYFDRGALDAEKLRLGGEWSAYWYGDHIYASESARGLDVLKLLPSAYLSKNEIEAAGLATQDDSSPQGGALNPQTQPRMLWPASPVVGRAYLDQLRREHAITPTRAAAVEAALNDFKHHDSALAARLEDDARLATGARNSERLRLLAALLRKP